MLMLCRDQARVEIEDARAMSAACRPIVWLTLAVGLTFALSFQAFGNTPRIDERTVCAEQAAARERAERIPPGLVHALALAESGRWSASDKSTRPWPWTVTSGRDSFYLPSKDAAIAKVEALQASGRTNIDVGCMQINLHYHPDAFANLDEAFDPDTNVGLRDEVLEAVARPDPLMGQGHGLLPLAKSCPWQRLSGSCLQVLASATPRQRSDGPQALDPAPAAREGETAVSERPRETPLDQAAITAIVAPQRHADPSRPVGGVAGVSSRSRGQTRCAVP